MRRAALNERGLTLTELTVVSVLASVVMLGFTGFYLSSQFTWLDGSAKAIAQREGTFLIETIRDSTLVASWYSTAVEHELALGKPDDPAIPFYVFRWDEGDSSLRAGLPGFDERLLQSRVRRFDVAFVDSMTIELSALELVTATGQSVVFRSRFALMNAEYAP